MNVQKISKCNAYDGCGRSGGIDTHLYLFLVVSFIVKSCDNQVFFSDSYERRQFNRQLLAPIIGSRVGTVLYTLLYWVSENFSQFSFLF